MKLWIVLYNRICDLGLSQKVLAAKIGISEQYVSDIMRGRRAVRQPEMIERWAAALQMPADILYFHAGLLAPDMHALPFSEECILAAFAAMRAALIHQEEHR